MIPREEIERALGAAEPVEALARLFRRAVEIGRTEPTELLGYLKNVAFDLRASGRSEDEDRLVDAMDFLAGWCRPDLRIERPKAYAFERAPGTSRGVWASASDAAYWRERLFPPTAWQSPTVVSLDLGGVFPTPAFLEEFLLPLARGISSGVYGEMSVVVRTHDPGVQRYITNLGKLYQVPLYSALRTYSIACVYDDEAIPAASLTPTEEETLTLVYEHPNGATSAQLAGECGIAITAAGNRLARLADRRLLMRIEEPGRGGVRYFDPRVFAERSSTTASDGAPITINRAGVEVGR